MDNDSPQPATPLPVVRAFGSGRVEKVVESVVDFTDIQRRLLNVDLDPWGPDGVRYVCVLLWDSVGYRHLANSFGVDAWLRWDASSGEFWDLFLAGCRAAPHTDTTATGDWRPLAVGDARSFLWSERAAHGLARQIAARHRSARGEAHDDSGPWEFTGPLELVAVGARRIRTRRASDPAGVYAETVEIDWGSLRSAAIEPRELSDAVSHYTQAHVDLDAAVIADPLPVPGSFTDPLKDPATRSALARGIMKAIGFIGKVTWSGGAAPHL